MAGNLCKRIDQWLISMVKGRSLIKGEGHMLWGESEEPVAWQFRDPGALVPEENPGGQVPRPWGRSQHVVAENIPGVPRRECANRRRRK